MAAREVGTVPEEDVELNPFPDRNAAGDPGRGAGAANGGQVRSSAGGAAGRTIRAGSVRGAEAVARRRGTPCPRSHSSFAPSHRRDCSGQQTVGRPTVSCFAVRLESRRTVRASPPRGCGAETRDAPPEDPASRRSSFKRGPPGRTLPRRPGIHEERGDLQWSRESPRLPTPRASTGGVGAVTPQGGKRSRTGSAAP
jgi:hypothetical protein